MQFKSLICIIVAIAIAAALSTDEARAIEERVQEQMIILRERPRLQLRLYNHPIYKIDVLLDDHTLHRGIPIGELDPALLNKKRLLQISGRRVAWERLLPSAAALSSAAQFPTHTEQLIRRLRPLLPTLPDAEDGAIDESGRWVKIETGAIDNEGGGFNCSGFSKWVIDGLLFPIAQRYLTIPQLKKRQQGRRGHSLSVVYAEQYDLYFGLDWSRALATAYYRARYGATAVAAENAVDVRDLPYFRYSDDIGYNVDDLYAILYLLALQEPYNFYLGSLNRNSNTTHSLRQHFHIALLFPYFTADGALQVVVLERNRETAFAQFLEQNRDYQIHLSRVASSAEFTPPAPPTTKRSE